MIGFCTRTEKAVENDGQRNTNLGRCIRNSHQEVGEETGVIGNQRENRNHLNYSMAEISENTQKSPGDLIRLAVTQSPVKNYQLTLVWKTRK